MMILECTIQNNKYESLTILKVFSIVLNFTYLISKGFFGSLLSYFLSGSHYVLKNESQRSI